MTGEVRNPEAYARAALDDECATLAATAHGRNDQVNRSGFACGQLIPLGYLARAEVEQRLMDAAEACGHVRKHGRHGTLATLRSGIESGMREPRDFGTGMRMEDVEILKPRPRLDGVPLPDWTQPGADGKPKLSAIGKAEPHRFDDEERRHRYVRDGEAVRFKIKKADGKWQDWYKVRRPGDGAIGWQARKPEGFVPVPYLPPGARNPFAAERRGEDLIWAEGEKDADAAVALGFLAFTFGSASDVPYVSDLLAGHHVVVAVDNDEAGRKSIPRKVGAAIKADARSIRLVQFPDLEDGGDLADFIAAGADAEAILDRAERIDPATWQTSPQADAKAGKTSRQKKAPPPRGANDARPVIALRAGAIKEAVDAAEAALIAAGGLYQRGNRIVYVGEAPVKTHDEREVMASRIFERGESALAEDIAEAACVMKWDARAEADVVVDPPARMVKTLKERVGRFRFPVLTAIINAPTLRPDGSLLDAPGYDSKTGLLFDPRGVEFPAIPRRPTRRDAERALAALCEVLSGFPFEEPSSRSVALSAILTACTRTAYPLAPLHGFSATAAGSGKGKLVDVPTVIATGREAGVTAQTANEEEMEKRLAALLLSGASTIAIDNCTAPLDGNLICAALTQPILTIRPFGKLDSVEVPSVAFLTATGNNLSVAGDMTRRTLVCKIDAGVERPELREFDFEPVARAKRDRVKLVSAALTILLAYQAAGAPRQAPPLGSFEEWSRMVRDALIWLGQPDPVDTMERARETDPKLHELSEVMAQWRAVIGPDPITVRKVIDKASRQGGPGGYDPGSREFTNPDLREALLAVAGQGGAISGKRLGKWLAAHAKKIVGGARFEDAGICDGSIMWRLREAKAAAPRPSAADMDFSRTVF